MNTARPDDTMETLAARIRESRLDEPGGWLYSPEDAARKMIAARDAAARLDRLMSDASASAAYKASR